MTNEMRERWRFFLYHAGYAIPPGRVVCAMELAHAEEWAERKQAEGCLTIEWVRDDDFNADDWEDWADPHAQRAAERDGAEGCVVEYHGEHVTSLWAIVGADQDYRRVIEAELALEAKGEIGA